MMNKSLSAAPAYMQELFAFGRHYTHIIWDFNGTLLDDTRTGIQSINTLLSRRGMEPIGSIAQYHALFCFPIVSYYKKVGFDFSKDPFDVLAREWVAEYEKNVPQAPLRPGTVPVLQAFQESGIEQIVLSASERGMLDRQLRDLGIRCFFTEILGTDDIYGTSKIEIGRNWARTAVPPRALMIGDTTHDFAAAQAMEMDCVLLTGGHQDKKTLSSCGCPVLGPD